MSASERHPDAKHAEEGAKRHKQVNEHLSERDGAVSVLFGVAHARGGLSASIKAGYIKRGRVAVQSYHQERDWETPKILCLWGSAGNS